MLASRSFLFALCYEMMNSAMFKTERHLFLSKTESHSFCLRQRDTIFVSDRETLFLSQTERHIDGQMDTIVKNSFFDHEKFSMLHFKYFFRQFSSIMYVIVIFQVSLKFVEPLQRKMMNKRTEKWTFAYYNIDT